MKVLLFLKLIKKKCYTNTYIQNLGKRHGISDFRNDKEKLIKIANYLREKIYLFKNIKFQKINYFLKNFSLKKYFK